MMLIVSVNVVSAHWWCPSSGVPTDYITRPVANYSTSYDPTTGNVTLRIQGKICNGTNVPATVADGKATSPFSAIYATEWLFGTTAEICTRNFSTGECGIGGYKDRRCVWQSSPVRTRWPSNWWLINTASKDVVVTTEPGGATCAGRLMWVINRTIIMNLSKYNSELAGNGKGFVMGVSNPGSKDSYRSYPSAPLTLQSYVINCSKDLDCEKNNMCLAGDNFCTPGGLTIYHKAINSTCENPGEITSYCKNSIYDLPIGTCNSNCSLGKCFG